MKMTTNRIKYSHCR